MNGHGGNLHAHYQVREVNEEATYRMTPNYDILEKAKLWRHWKDPWLPGVRAGRMKRQTEHGGLEGRETTLCDSMMVNTRHCT